MALPPKQAKVNDGSLFNTINHALIFCQQAAETRGLRIDKNSKNT
jgi:hypothetical protein